MLSSEGAHFLKTSSDVPACSIPGVAKRTIGPGASAYERSKDPMCLKSNMFLAGGIRKEGRHIIVSVLPLHKRLFDLLVCPVDEQLVVLVGLLGHACGKVDGHLQVDAVPVRVQEDA